MKKIREVYLQKSARIIFIANRPGSKMVKHTKSSVKKGKGISTEKSKGKGKGPANKAVESSKSTGKGREDAAKSSKGKGQGRQITKSTQGSTSGTSCIIDNYHVKKNFNALS